MPEAAGTPPSERSVEHPPRPLWRRLLVGLLITIALGSAILLGVAGYAAVFLLTSDNKGEPPGPAFAFGAVLIVMASAAATLILSAGGAWLLVRRSRGTSRDIAPLYAWSPLRVALTVLVLIVLLRVSIFGLLFLFQLENPVFWFFYNVLKWATLLGPLLAALLVLVLQRRIRRVS